MSIFGAGGGAGGSGAADGPGELTFGSNNIFTTKLARYLNPGGDRESAGTVRLDMAVERNGILDGFTVKQGEAGAGTGTITYEILVDDVGTGITLGFNPADAIVQSAAGTVAILKGQTVGVTATKSDAITLTPTKIYARIGFTV